MDPSKMPRLKDRHGDNMLRFPVFTPSRMRWDTGLLDLKLALANNAHFQLIGLQQYVEKADGEKIDQLVEYQRHWPCLNFFVRPHDSPDSHGASRFWLKHIAEKIVPESFPYVFMVDDNVQRCPLP